MYLQWKNDRKTEGASSVKGAYEGRFGWRRGARKIRSVVRGWRKRMG